MASPRKILASQVNGSKSRGPVTAQGKFRSSLNAITHSLSGNTIVLSNESRERFDQLHKSLHGELQPASHREEFLIEQMAVSLWQVRRSWGIETALYDHQMDAMQKSISETYDQIDEVTRLALAFKELGDTSHAASNIARYQTRHQRHFDRALAELRRIQSERRAATGQERPDFDVLQNEPNEQPQDSLPILDLPLLEGPAQ